MVVITTGFSIVNIAPAELSRLDVCTGVIIGVAEHSIKCFEWVAQPHFGQSEAKWVGCGGN